MSALLREQAGRQVLLKVKPHTGGRTRELVVTPISMSRENDLRYDEWEYTRRLAVEKATNNRMGYVHLRALGREISRSGNGSSTRCSTERG